MITQRFKSSITNIPTYLDGYISIYENVSNVDVFPSEKYKLSTLNIPFEELSIYDRIRLEAHQKNINLSTKVRIYQDKTINSLHLVKVGNDFHKIFNIVHFTNNDGFEQTELTLIKMEKEVILDV